MRMLILRAVIVGLLVTGASLPWGVLAAINIRTSPITSILFGLAHVSHGFSVIRVSADAVFGALYGLTAYASGSILPGIVLHCSFNTAEFLFIRALRELPPGRQWFWVHFAESLVLAAAAWFAFRKLAKLRIAK